MTALMGCATMFNGKPQVIPVTSDVVVNIVVKNATGIVVFEGVTPAELKLPRNSTYTVTVSAPGYASETFALNQKIQGWFWVSLCTTGLVGIIVDAATGSMNELTPAQLNVTVRTVSQNNTEMIQVGFFAKDEEGNLRFITLPLVRA